MSENKVIQWYLEKTLKNWEKNTKMFLNNLEAITSCELWKPWKIIKPHTRLLRSCNQKPILIFSILGKTCPRPVKAWQQCGVTSKIFDILKANFKKPTPIQAQAISVIMSGRDMITGMAWAWIIVGFSKLAFKISNILDVTPHCCHTLTGRGQVSPKITDFETT